MDPPLQALIAAAASFLFVSFVFSLILLLCHRSPKPPSQTLALRPPPPLAPPHPPPRPIFADESASFDPSIDHISMSELAAATKNFAADCIVGDGSFGFVYKAKLSNGTTVAVKKLSADAFHGFREFCAEMETLGRIRHPNLARILGYCISGLDRVLIYEFLDGGSLDERLHNNTCEESPLPWSTRVRIVRGVAAGLAFLHEDCKPCIIHRDIKSSNVLLDANFEARIADFGLARRVDSSRSHVSTQVAGTMGYMAPEYREGITMATRKADVYSFGILMMEVVTRRRPNWPVKVEGKEVWLIRWARGMVEQGRGLEMVDPLMGKEGLREEDLRGYLDVAYRCTSEPIRERPFMGEVVSLLNQLSCDTELGVGGP